jgi:hypothetical protein
MPGSIILKYAHMNREKLYNPQTAFMFVLDCYRHDDRYPNTFNKYPVEYDINGRPLSIRSQSEVIQRMATPAALTIYDTQFPGWIAKIQESKGSLEDIINQKKLPEQLSFGFDVAINPAYYLNAEGKPRRRGRR